MKLFTGEATGDWRFVHGGQKEESLVTKNLFRLTIEHGIAPRKAVYAVGVFPGASPEETSRRSLKNILCNTPDIQAVRLADQSIAAVFYRPGTLLGFHTDSPGVFLIQKQTHTVSSADPTHRLSQMTLSLDGNSKTVTLPSDQHAGSTITVHFSP